MLKSVQNQKQQMVSRRQGPEGHVLYRDRDAAVQGALKRQVETPEDRRRGIEKLFMELHKQGGARFMIRELPGRRRIEVRIVRGETQLQQGGVVSLNLIFGNHQIVIQRGTQQGLWIEGAANSSFHDDRFQTTFPKSQHQVQKLVLLKRLPAKLLQRELFPGSMGTGGFLFLCELIVFLFIRRQGRPAGWKATGLVQD